MTDPSFVCDQKQDAYAEMSEGPEDAPEPMEAIIIIGDLNICVDCGKVRITAALDSDGLPLCERCSLASPDPPLDDCDFADWDDEPGYW